MKNKLRRMKRPAHRSFMSGIIAGESGLKGNVTGKQAKRGAGVRIIEKLLLGFFKKSAEYFLKLAKALDIFLMGRVENAGRRIGFGDGRCIKPEPINHLG